MTGLLVPPIYVQTPGYGRTWMYMPYELMPATAAAFKTWVQNLEALIGPIEGISIGLPNGMNDPTSTIARTALLSQAVVWAMPGTINGTSGGGSMDTLVGGGYNSLIDGTAAAFAAIPGGGAAVGLKGEHWIRAMWEYDFSNYTWGHNVGTNNDTKTAQGFDLIHTRMVGGGYRGKIMLCAGVDPRPMYNSLAHPELINALGIDFYNTNGGVSGQYNWDTTWLTKKGFLDSVANFCRANGLTLLFPEGGCEVKSDPWHSRPPNFRFWTDLDQWAEDNCDVAEPIAPFNQGIPSGNVTKSADDALTFCVPAGTAATTVAALGTMHSTSTTGPWTWNLDDLKKDEVADFQANRIAGRYQKAPLPPVPPSTITAVAATPDYIVDFQVFA